MTKINPEEGTVMVAQALAMEDGKVFGVPAENIKVAIEHFLSSVPHDTIVGLAKVVQLWDLTKPDNYVGIVLARREGQPKEDSIQVKARFIWTLLFVGANQNRVRATFDALGIDPTVAFQTPPTNPGEGGAGEQSFSL